MQRCFVGTVTGPAPAGRRDITSEFYRTTLLNDPDMPVNAGCSVLYIRVWRWRPLVHMRVTDYELRSFIGRYFTDLISGAAFIDWAGWPLAPQLVNDFLGIGSCFVDTCVDRTRSIMNPRSAVNLSNEVGLVAVDNEIVDEIPVGLTRLRRRGDYRHYLTISSTSCQASARYSGKYNGPWRQTLSAPAPVSAPDTDPVAINLSK
jgi:hypothetical protein